MFESFLMMYVAPVVIGYGMWWFAGRCKGRNAKAAFQFAAWGWWLTLLRVFAFLIPLPGFLAMILLLTPTVLCFLLAASSMLKEMRAQKAGQYTDAA